LGDQWLWYCGRRGMEVGRRVEEGKERELQGCGRKNQERSI
jgi:hypothetical protein